MPCTGAASAAPVAARRPSQVPVGVALGDPAERGGGTAGAMLQRKSHIPNAPADRFEQEADAVAREAVAATAPDRAPGRARAGAAVPESVLARVEPLLDAGLGHVRIRADATAAAVARRLNANAFSHGDEIWLGSGSRSTDVGLMAHELTHTVQQGRPQGARAPSIQRQEATQPTTAPTVQPSGQTTTQASQATGQPPTTDPLTAPLTDWEWRGIGIWLSRGEVSARPLTADPEHNANPVAAEIFCNRWADSPDWGKGDPLLCILSDVTAVDPRVQAIRRMVTARGPLLRAMPSAEELTRRLVQAIGVWETNRGGTAPRPRESELQTVAGVRASMATVEQATMPYLVTALGQHSELRALATPPLTADEVTAAQTRINAVDALLRSVGASARAGTTADDFIQANAAQITAAGLSNDNVRTMFRAVALQATVTEAHERVEHQRPPPGESRPRTAAQEAAAIPEAQRLGISERSLTRYVADTRIWGENRAAWERLAVQQMPNNVGARIESVALANQGTALAAVVVRDRVNAQLARTPPPTEEQLVRAVATQNNPHEAGYGANIWATYQRLFPAQVPAQAPAAPAAAPH